MRIRIKKAEYKLTGIIAVGVAAWLTNNFLSLIDLILKQ